MKKVQLIALFFGAAMTITACGGDKKTVTEEGTTTPKETPVYAEGIKIGYYNSDSLNANYKLIKAIEKDLEAQVNTMSSNFEAKVKSFENWARSYDEKIKNNMLISSEIQKFQEQFQQRQMALAQEEQQLQGKIQQLQNDNLIKAFNRVENFVKNYAEKNGFDMILQYAKGGQVIYISPGMDVTEDIVNGLNTEYTELNETLESEE